MDLKKTLHLSILISGATAMISQILYLREFMVVFYGNEISVGIILACWLLWSSLGSYVMGRFADRLKITAYSWCLLAMSLILPLTFYLIRVSHGYMNISTGEIIGYIPMAISSFFILSLSCFVSGFMFSLACVIYKDANNIPAEKIARIYIIESIGALAGGMAVSCFLIRIMPAMDIIFTLAFLNISASVALQLHRGKAPLKTLQSAISLIILLSGVSMALSGRLERIRDISLKQLWKGYDVVESRDSVYGNITVTRTGGQISFFENGLNLYSVPDALSAEEPVHFTMLEHGDPSDILLVGGGIGGLIGEILKYDVAGIDYVELDPVIVEMARKHLDKAYVEDIDDGRVRIINSDGRFFVKKTRKKYDCVIVDLGNPYTAQLNRFYTREFFSEVYRVLKKGGILSFGLTASENYIGGELSDFLNSIYLSLEKVFDDIVLVPGDTMYFLASKGSGILTGDHKKLVERLQRRGVNTEFVREYYLFSKLSAERVEYADNAVRKNRDVRINTDFNPVSYFYAMAFWGTHFDMTAFQGFLRSITPENIWIAATFLCLLILFFGMVNRGATKRRRVLMAVMTTGFAEIVFQISVIIAFQVIYGFVFYKIGVIMSSFMAGLAAGSWYMYKKMRHIKDDKRYFNVLQAGICIYPLIIPFCFLWLSKSGSGTVSWLGSNIIFPFLPVVSGMIGGMQFPLANKIYLGNDENAGHSAGISYGLDLMGACAGSLLASTVMIPVLGIFGACFLAALLNVSVLSVLLLR